MTWERVINFDDATHEQNQHDREAMSMSSAPVAGYDCGMKWVADRTHSYSDVDQIYCGTFSYSRKMSLAGNGQGYYTARLVGSDQDGYHGSIFGYGDGTMHGTQTDTVADCTSPDANGTTTRDVSQEAYDMPRGGRCDEGWTGSWQIESRTVQAMVGSCSYNVVITTDTNTTVHRENITWRFRRTDCDRTVDTDGDRLSDCTEYALQTNPSDPDTDRDALTDGQEVLTYGTDPRDRDSDDGGVQDGDEVGIGADPLEPTDDSANCRYLNSSWVARLVEPEYRDIDPRVYHEVLRYSWDDIRYCWGETGVRIISTGAQRGEVTDTPLETAALELIGMKLKYDGSRQAFVERLPDDSLQAKVRGRFDVCTQIPLLGPVIGKGIKKVLNIVPEPIRKKLLEWGPKKVMNSSLIPAWVKNKIIRRGVNAVLRSFEALNDEDLRRVMNMFTFVADKVGGKLIELLTDGKCFATWRPELVARFYADGSAQIFDQGVGPQWWVLPDTEAEA